MKTNTFEQIKQILVDRFAIAASQINPASRLQTELGMDSLDAVDLLMAINETYRIRVPDSALENIHTVSELMSVVEKYRSGNKKHT